MRLTVPLWLAALLLMPALAARAGDVKDTEVYARLKKQLDAVRAVDTHSHLGGPGHPQALVDRNFHGTQPTDCALSWIWRRSYLTWAHPLAPWPAAGKFDTWWASAQADFDNYRARSAYRTMLPIFEDLYGLDFETLTPEQARELNDRMEKTWAEDPNWAEEVLCRRANIETMVVDAARFFPIRNHHSFVVFACNVRMLINGFHPSEFAQWNSPSENPYVFAKQSNLPVESLDDYVAVLDRILGDAKQAGAICLKSQIAYDRTLRIDFVDKPRAEAAFGKPRRELAPAEVKAFQDYVFWRLAELSAKHDLPFQIHTGHARIPGSNPMNLVPLIAANPKTKFILFHGGFPWVSESGMIALKYPHVWLDSVWTPTLSYTMGKRAYQEWLDMFSSDRILWGSDMFTIEGSYGAAVWTRQCITEALAEKVINHELREEHAVRIGRQILRENALALFPSLRDRAGMPADAAD